VLEAAARQIAARACKVIREDGRRTVCVELLAKVLAHGDSVKGEVAEEIKKAFTEEERRLLREELARLLE
jgi:DNA-binding MarR family transcriptional regulator